MWIRKIDFPQPLIDAHRAGELVIFVGAGASFDPPANLPMFGALTKAVARDAQLPVDDNDANNPDVFLGSLKDRGIDVHRLVYDRIGDPESKPNKLHEALVDLAIASGHVRVVTTNYDVHLSTTLCVRGIDFQEYAAPALPMGDDFTGVVYLHGSLRQEPRHLVMTDGDFGRAYLRDAWAARFLERMFGAFTVLFVGYSYGDVVMRYLARALGPQGARYILTHTPESPDWASLGIRPVGYEVVDGYHAALGEAVAGWASHSSMGWLGHRQRVIELVSTLPSQVPEEESYLESVCADPGRVALFTEYARDEHWLRWITTRPEFKLLLDQSASPTACGAAIARWFAEHFVMNEDLTNSALRVVEEAGGRLSSTLWHEIGQSIHAKAGPRPRWLDPWIVLLVRDTPRDRDDWLEYALVGSNWPEDREAILLLFGNLTRPGVQLRPSFGHPGSPSFEVFLLGKDYWLRRAWQEIILPNLASLATDIISILDQHLRDVRRILVLSGSANESWDPVSYGRSAIEPHEQDAHADAIDVLIDASRDTLLALLENDSPLGVAYLNSWADSPVPLLRRLAIHAWARRTDIDDSAKIAWLCKRRWLYDTHVHHEVYALIGVALAGADETVAEKLVIAAIEGPEDEPDDDHHAYRRFNTLSWIIQHSPGLTTATDALESIRSDHPDFAERAHPGLLSWMTVGAVASFPPMSVDDLHNRINSDVAQAVSELLEYKNDTFLGEGPTRSDALAVLAAAVRNHPKDGLAILDINAGDFHADITSAVVQGWSAASMDDATIRAVLERMTSLDLTEAHSPTADLLAEGGHDSQHPVKWHTFNEARTLATQVWDAIPSQPIPSEVDDWLLRAINTSAGKLARFWMNAVSADWNAAGESWSGLSEPLRGQLEAILGGSDDRSAMAQVVLASQVQFFFGADRLWAEQHILPLLDWAEPERALRAWHGYLTWGRANDSLLAAGLLKGFLGAAKNLELLRDQLAAHLLRQLAGIALRSGINPLAWIQQFTAEVDIAHRVQWMLQVAWILGDTPSEEIEDQWQRWMRPYWQSRLKGIPRSMTIEEASAMAGWVVHLTDSLEEGVDLAVAHPVTLTQHPDVLHAINVEQASEAPALYARLIAHLMQGAQPPCWGCNVELRRLLPSLNKGGDSDDINTIVEQAIRLGYIGAESWLSDEDD